LSAKVSSLPSFLSRKRGGVAVRRAPKKAALAGGLLFFLIFFYFWACTRWQATKWPGVISCSLGLDSLHWSQAWGQRPAKLQPLGVLMGLGTSPEIIIRFFCASSAGSGMGTADSKALE